MLHLISLTLFKFMKRKRSWSFLLVLCVSCKSEEIESVVGSYCKMNETCLYTPDIYFSALRLWLMGNTSNYNGCVFICVMLFIRDWNVNSNFISIVSATQLATSALFQMHREISSSHVKNDCFKKFHTKILEVCSSAVMQSMVIYTMCITLHINWFYSYTTFR